MEDASKEEGAWTESGSLGDVTFVAWLFLRRRSVAGLGGIVEGLSV